MLQTGVHVFMALCFQSDQTSCPGSQALDLSRSEDLLCRNLVCERVGEPCICRLAGALERHAATLAWLSLAGNGLTQLPAALTALPALRYLDVSANELSALPAGFTDLRSLQVCPCPCGSCCFTEKATVTSSCLCALSKSTCDLPVRAASALTDLRSMYLHRCSSSFFMNQGLGSCRPRECTLALSYWVAVLLGRCAMMITMHSNKAAGPVEALHITGVERKPIGSLTLDCTLNNLKVDVAPACPIQ